MKLKELLELNLDNIPSLTIGAVDGERWLCYHNGREWVGNDLDGYLDREVKELWFRPGRKNNKDVYGNPILPLERGIGIILEGDDRGKI